MGKTFKIERDVYEDGVYLYKKKNVTFEPGLTVLVGCNGCGKTTLIKQIKTQLKDKSSCVISFDNIKDGGFSAIDKALFYKNTSFAAASWNASEGERIALNMQNLASVIGSAIRNNPDEKEVWILLDGIDSGFSIDAIEDLKKGLFDVIFETSTDKDVYIIASANEYELARGEKCFDVVNCRYVNIKSYDRYRKVVMKSREYKDSRNT